MIQNLIGTLVNIADTVMLGYVKELRIVVSANFLPRKITPTISITILNAKTNPIETDRISQYNITVLGNTLKNVC